MFAVMLAVNYFDRITQMASEAEASLKAVGVVVAIAIVLGALAISRRLGAVVAAIILAGVGLMAINNTSDLETNAKDTFIGGAKPAGIIMPFGGFAGGGAGGGGGGSR